jgi:hypothetical protein
MLARQRLLLICLTAFVAAGLAPGPARAADAEARSHYARGAELYGQQHYAEALREFEQAYALHRSPAMLFTLGQAHYQLGHYARARRSLEDYLAQSGAQVPSARRADVESQLEWLRQETGYILVSVNVASAVVSIDGEAIGLSPLTQPVLSDTGSHRVSAMLDGYTPASVRLDVTAQQSASARLQLIPPPKDSGHAFETGSWIAAGSFGALAVASAIVTLVGYRNYDAARRQPQGGDPARARKELEDQRADVEAWALATDLLGAACLVSGGVALYLSLGSTQGPRAEDRALSSRGIGSQLTATLEF